MEPSWAIVELMGHVRIAGRVSEEERFGAKLGRIDIPKSPSPACLACKGTGRIEDFALDDAGTKLGTTHACRMPECNGFTTQFFSGSSIYRMTPCSEEAARAVAAWSQPEPVHSWEMPKQIPSCIPHDLSGPGDVDDDDVDDNRDDEF
jgi:hypothetical protein